MEKEIDQETHSGQSVFVKSPKLYTCYALYLALQWRLNIRKASFKYQYMLATCVCEKWTQEDAYATLAYATLWYGRGRKQVGLDDLDDAYGRPVGLRKIHDVFIHVRIISVCSAERIRMYQQSDPEGVIRAHRAAVSLLTS